MDETMTVAGVAVFDDGQEVPEEQPVKTYRMHVTQEVLERVSWGDYRKAMQNDLDALTNIMGSCLISPEGKRLSHSEAIEVLDQMSIVEVMRLAEQFGELAQEAAAPKGLGTAST